MPNTLTPRRSKRKLASYALDNAHERLAAFHALHEDVINEYLRLRDEVRLAASALGHFEHSLATFIRDLNKVYDKN